MKPSMIFWGWVKHYRYPVPKHPFAFWCLYRHFLRWYRLNKRVIYMRAYSGDLR